MCINKIENRITFRIKTGYYLEPLTPETMKLLGSTKRKIAKDENGENVPYLEMIEVGLIHCSVADNSYPQNSRALFTFIPNKSFGQLLDISAKNFIFSKTFDSEFSYIEVWFTDQSSNPLEIEDKIKITLVINESIIYTNMAHYSVQPGDQIFVKVYGFLSFARNMGKNVGRNISQKIQ